MTKVTLVDGTSVADDAPAVRAGDPGLLGIGVYESLRTYGGEPFALALHLERLASGARALGLAVDLVALERELREAARRAREDDAEGEVTLRVVLTGGGTRIVEAGPLVRRPMLVRAVTLPWRRPAQGPLTGIKAASTAATRVASRVVNEAGVDDGLWLTSEGMVSEAMAANVFAVLGGRLVTPPLRDGPLPGVTRHLLLRLGAQERSFPLSALLAADEAFLAATSFPARSLVEVDGRLIGDGTPGPVARGIAERFAHEAAALLS